MKLSSKYKSKRVDSAISYKISEYPRQVSALPEKK